MYRRFQHKKKKVISCPPDFKGKRIPDRARLVKSPAMGRLVWKSTVPFVVGIAELDLSSMLGLWSEAKDLNHMVMVSGPDLVVHLIMGTVCIGNQATKYKYGHNGTRITFFS